MGTSKTYIVQGLGDDMVEAVKNALQRKESKANTLDFFFYRVLGRFCREREIVEMKGGTDETQEKRKA